MPDAERLFGSRAGGCVNVPDLPFPSRWTELPQELPGEAARSHHTAFALMTWVTLLEVSEVSEPAATS